MTVRAIFAGDQNLHKMFDGADAELLVEQRDSSVTAPQMLFFLNSPTVQMTATAVAKRASNDVEKVYRLLFARSPSDAERQLATAFLKKQSFERYCHLLLCTSEFMYLE